MKRALAVGLLLAGCSAKVDEAELWTITQFQSPENPNEDFGGWLPERLLLKEGARLHARRADETQVAGSLGLAIFPGVADGVSTPFTVTEVWKKHPEPWVQPVWSPRSAADSKVRIADNVFPFGADASFYSPFWQLELVLVPDGAKPPQSAREALASTAAHPPGPRVLCPVLPNGATVALSETVSDAGVGPLDPATLAPLKRVTQSSAFIDASRSVPYLDFGEDRFLEDGQHVVSAQAYFFLSSKGERLPVAAVLPSDSRRHPLVWRVDVTLPEGAGVYVPSTRPELREALKTLAPMPLKDTVERTLQVVLNAECFQSPTFPGSCHWLDSAAAVQALDPSRLKKTDFQLTAVALDPQASP